MTQTEIPGASQTIIMNHSPARPSEALFAYLASRWTAPVPSQPGKMTDCEFAYIHSLAQDYLQYVLQEPSLCSAPSKTSRLLQKLAFSAQKEVEKNLNPYLENIEVTSIDKARVLFNQVMEKEFEDGIINWGRIVTIFAFGGILLKKLPREQTDLDVDTNEQISSFVAEFIMNNTGEWIRQNGGWENGFIKKFEPTSGWLVLLDITGHIWKMLFYLKQYY